jgi:hypothetical protein
MKNWRYYETWGPCLWRINNKKTNQFFLCEYEKDAKWLTDRLNSMEDSRFDDGIALTDDGDLVKINKKPNQNYGGWHLCQNCFKPTTSQVCHLCGH